MSLFFVRSISLDSTFKNMCPDFGMFDKISLKLYKIESIPLFYVGPNSERDSIMPCTVPKAVNREDKRSRR